MVGILGAGLMGKSIAVEIAKHGIDVKLLSAQRHLSASQLKEEIEKIVSRMKVVNPEEVFSHIQIASDYKEFEGCDLIIEALKEDLVVKRTTLKELISSISSNCVFSSNTSSLSINDIFKDIIPLENVLGTHFFNPPHVMKLVELSTLDQTSSNTINFALNFIKGIDKEAIFVKNSPGFVVNKLLIPFINEAAVLLEEKIASAEDIDKAMLLGANHPIGPLKLADLIGIDVVVAILKTFQKNNPQLKISPLLEKMVLENKLGRKTKIGFYDYVEKR